MILLLLWYQISPSTSRGIGWRVPTKVIKVAFIAVTLMCSLSEVYEYKIEHVSPPISDQEMHHEQQMQHKVC